MQYDEAFLKAWDNSQQNAIAANKAAAYKIWQAAVASVQPPSEPEKKVLELEGGSWYIAGANEAQTGRTLSKYRVAGLERRTEEDAIKATKRRAVFDKLAAWVYERSGHDGSWDVEHNRFLTVQVDGSVMILTSSYPDLANVFMDTDTALWLRDRINAKEIVL